MPTWMGYLMSGIIGALLTGLTGYVALAAKVARLESRMDSV